MKQYLVLVMDGLPRVSIALEQIVAMYWEEGLREGKPVKQMQVTLANGDRCAFIPVQDVLNTLTPSLEPPRKRKEVVVHWWEITHKA